MTCVAVSITFAASVVLSSTTGAGHVAQFEDMNSWHIRCYNIYGIVVVNVPLAYGVSMNTNGTVIYYRDGWLSENVRTVVKSPYATCDIGPNQWPGHLT